MMKNHENSGFPIEELFPLSSAYGKIKSVLMSVGPVRGDRTIDSVVQRIISFFPPEVEFWMITKLATSPQTSLTRARFDEELGKQKRAFTQLFESPLTAADENTFRHKINFIFVDDFKYAHLFPPVIGGMRPDPTPSNPRIRSYAQDAFLSLRSTMNKPYLLDPFYNRTNFDSTFMADIVGERLNIAILPFRYTFEGGNILTGDDYILIGKDTLKENFLTEKGEQEWSNLKDALSIKDRESGNVRKIIDYYSAKINIRKENIIWIGCENLLKDFHSGTPTFQPLYHIDLFLTIGGRVKGYGKDVIFIGYPREEYCIGDKFSNEDCKKITNLRAALDETEYLLTKKKRKKKFKVVKLPLIIEKDRNKLVLHSFNNCLVENYFDENQQSIQNAYLPDFSSQENDIGKKSAFQRIQMRTEEIFNKHHFNTEWINGPVNKWSHSRAGIHCHIKVIYREHL